MSFPTDDDLILFYYGEAERATEIEALLAGSPELAARYEELRRVLDAVDDAMPVPQRPEDYGAQVWRRLVTAAPHLRARRSSAAAGWRGRLLDRWREPLWPAVAGWRSLPRLAAAAAVLLAVGFLLGRVFQPAGEPPRVAAAGLPAAGRDQILVATVANHLERSGRLLLEVANTEPEPAEVVDLGAERRWAEDLLAANRLYRQSARRGGRPRLAALLDELEPLLLELAHTPEEMPAEELATLRERIEERALLFKMRIVADRLERLERRRRAAAGPDVRTVL
jgi:hypothetical protein